MALVTPFKTDKSIDFDALNAPINYVIDGGVQYVVTLGTTGETPIRWQAEEAVRTRVLPTLRALPGVQRVELFGAGPPTLWSQPRPAHQSRAPLRPFPQCGSWPAERSGA